MQGSSPIFRAGFRKHLRTSTEQFYIRTAHPPSLPPAGSWRIAGGGLVAEERLLDIGSMESEARDIGLRLMECAGNSDPANFGLLSAAEWGGVPMSAVLERIRPLPAGRRVRVTGFDDEQQPSVTSNPGASWVFTREELDRTGAFLALRMNGAALTADHGAPIRLVVPNYYGCSCIKWVARIDWVGDDEQATSQMMEFSARTHQKGVLRLARDYQPPVIDLAAVPIRVEQWMVTRDGRERVVYRVVGVRWGGTVRHPPLTIRFRNTEPFVPVSDSQAIDDPSAWSLWSHEWTPDAPGRYQITLGVPIRPFELAGSISTTTRARSRSTACRPDTHFRASPRASASSGRSGSARCQIARNSIGGAPCFEGVSRSSRGTGQPQHRDRPAGKPQQYLAVFGDGDDRLAEPRQRLRIQLTGRLRWIWPRDRLRPRRLTCLLPAPAWRGRLLAGRAQSTATRSLRPP